MYKEDVLAFLALIILMVMWVFTLQLILSDSAESEKDVYSCPVCRNEFEYSENQSKIICSNCGYIMIFDIKEE